MAVESGEVKTNHDEALIPNGIRHTMNKGTRSQLMNVRAQALSVLALVEEMLGVERSVPSRRERRRQ